MRLSRQWSFVLLIFAGLLTTAFFLSSKRISTVQEDNAPNQAVEITPATEVIIHKPDNDKRTYHYLTLENQLRVLLISDPETDKSAASLDVHVGSSDDPKGREGLAHFLEHMLFLGTEKYPDAAEYQTFISENGGNDNAYTSAEHTNYFFDVKADQFEGALDRFSQFFIAPLFDEQYVDRERHAVHSEYQARIKDDNRRGYDVYRQVINPNHPYVKFSVGSLDTLADRDNDNVRDDLIAFYNKHYSSDQMTLAVLGKESIDELKALVVPRFSTIPLRNVEENNISIPLFEEGTLPLEVTVKPVKESREMRLVFPLPSAKPYYQEKPLSYIAFLLGHEGQGSLLSLLKAQGWAEGLSAGSSDSGAGNTAFYIVISLTRKGLEYKEQIKALAFHALSVIQEKGVEQWRYAEEQMLANISFQFREQDRPLSLVSGLADALHDYPPEEVMRASYLYKKFDAPLIHSFLEKMTPENLYVGMVYPEAETDKVTYYYDVPYKVSALSNTLVDIPDELKQQYQLPDKNAFIPENIQQVQHDENLLEPQKVNDGNLTIWAKQDIDFNIPKATIRLRAKLPVVANSLNAAVLNEMLLALINDRLNENSYPALIAGLSYTLSANNRGFDISLGGYSDKMGVLLSMLIDEIKTPYIDQSRFQNVKVELLRRLHNSKKYTPYRQLFRQLPSALFKPYWTDQQIADRLESVTITDVQNFSAQWRNGLEAQGLFYGNIEQSTIDQWQDVLGSLLQAGELTLKTSKVLKLPEDKTASYTMPVDHNDKTVALYVQGLDDTITDQARMVLFREVFEAPFYSQLRTEQQLGYIVFLTNMGIKEVPGSVFVVQSPNTTTEGIKQAIELFITDSYSLIPDDLQRYQQSAITRILEKPQTLADKSGNYWNEILKGDDSFSYRRRLADAVSQVSSDELRNYYKKVALDEYRRIWLALEKGLDDTLVAPSEQDNYYIYP